MLQLRLIASPIVDPSSLIELNSFIDEHISRSGNSVNVIVVRARRGFQAGIDRYIGDRLKKNRREQLFLCHTQLRPRSQRPTFLQKMGSDISLLGVVTLLGALQETTTFIRGTPKDHWELSTETIYHSFVFIYFLQFFTSLLQLSGLAAKYALKSDLHPEVTLTGNDVVIAPSFPVSSRNIIGGFDPTQTTSNQFAEMPPLLTLANNGLLSVAPEQLDQGAMEALTNLSSSVEPSAYLGGATTHIIPLNLMIKFNELDGEAPPSDLIYRQSGRIQTVIDIPTIHSATPTVLRNIRHAISESIFRVPQEEFQSCVRREVSDAIIRELRLDRFGFVEAADSDLGDYVVWTPEIRNIITRITQASVYLGSPITASQIVDDFRSNITPLVVRQVAREFARYRGVPLASMGRGQPRMAEPTGVESPAQHQFLNCNGKLWRNAVGNRHHSPIRFSLYKETPILESDWVRALEHDDPFIFIAGRRDLVLALKSAVDLRVQRAQSEHFETPDKPLIVVITDGDSVGKTLQFSSGKTTLTEATARYINRRYDQLDIRRPLQILSSDNGLCRYTLRDPVVDTPNKIARPTLYHHWPLQCVILIQTVLFSMVNVKISQVIFDDIDPIQEKFAAIIFPWTVYAVSLGLSAALLYGNRAIDKKMSDPDPMQLDSGKSGIIHLPFDVTKEQLLGKSVFTPQSPQSQFRFSPRIWVTEMTFNSVLIENAHKMDPVILRTLFEMSATRTASLGETLPIPFTMRVLGICANDPKGEIQEMASDYADVRAEVSVLLDYPAGDNLAAERISLEQLFLFHIRSEMTIPWDNISINALLDRCIMEKKQKIFFGIRYIKNFIKDVERIHKRQNPTSSTIEKSVFDAAWNNFLGAHPYISAYFN
jgi:hypothetical protein